jgi:glycosyltransferase involved in cell wall biosynthesis
VLISAGNLNDRRKGVAFAVQAIKAVSDLNPYLLVLGNADPGFLSSLCGLDHCAVGYIGDPEQLSEIYAAADVFLFCSLADNQPLAILEAMAAGTPIVGFATGGIPELVEHLVAGYLAPTGDVCGVVHGLRTAFSGDNCREWAKKARSRVETQFSHQRLLLEHLDVYGSVTGTVRSPPPLDVKVRA